MFDKSIEWQEFIDSSISTQFSSIMASLYSVLLNLRIEQGVNKIVTSEMYLAEQSFYSLYSVRKYIHTLIDTKLVSVTEDKFGKGIHEYIVLLPKELSI